MVDPRPFPEALFQEPRYQDVEDAPGVDLGDAISEYFAHHPDHDPGNLDRPFRTVPVGEGPELDDQTEFEYEREKRT